MDNSVMLAVLTIIGSVLGSVLGVWAFTRRNESEVKKAKALSDVKAQDAETKERADLIDMIKESTKQGSIWLDALKVIEKQRERDYATAKDLIEDGTLETINARKEIVKGVDELSVKQDGHHDETINVLNEVQMELKTIKRQVDAIPGTHQEILKRLDIVLGSVEILTIKRITNETPAASLPTNGSLENKTPPA